MPNKVSEDLDNVISIIPEELRGEYSEGDIILLNELAQRNEVNLIDVLKSARIRDELRRLNDKLEKEQRGAFLGANKKDIEQPIMHQKRWYLGNIISGLRDKIAKTEKIEKEGSNG